MFNKFYFIFVALLFFFSAVFSPVAGATQENGHPVEVLVDERLTYDVSFLWFKHLAEGSIRLERGEQPGTYLATMEARTLGLAAFVTKHRVEKYQTLMDIGPDGSLRPLVHSSHTYKGQGRDQREKKTSYTFDYVKRQVHYKKIKYRRVTADELLPFETEGAVYDILSAFYNLRIGTFGPLDQKSIRIPTFHRKGVEDIVITQVAGRTQKDKKFFSAGGTLCKILVDPSIFKTNGRELFASFDKNNRLVRGIVKNVIGLGDVKGVLRQTVKYGESR